MQIHHLALRVGDLARSVWFYETLTELKVVSRFRSGTGEVAYLQNATGHTAGTHLHAGRRQLCGPGVVFVLCNQ